MIRQHGSIIVVANCIIVQTNQTYSLTITAVNSLLPGFAHRTHTAQYRPISHHHHSRLFQTTVHRTLIAKEHAKTY